MATAGEFCKWWKTGQRPLATRVRNGSDSSVLSSPACPYHPQNSTGFWSVGDPGPSQSLWVSFVQETKLWQIIVLMCVRISECASHLFIHSFLYAHRSIHPQMYEMMSVCTLMCETIY